MKSASELRVPARAATRRCTRWRSGNRARPTTLLFIAILVPACGPRTQDPPEAGTVVFTIPEPDLLPENVAYDPQTRSYFVGSTRKGKILRVADGAVTEFKGPREDGLWMVIGMKVDAARRVLWVCSSQGGNLEGSMPNTGQAAGLFRFNIDSGALLDRWVLDREDEEHFLNDIVLTGAGSAYVTHMFADPAVWVAEPGGEFEAFAELPSASYPNGIAISSDERSLYVASSGGLLHVDLDDHSVESVAAPGLPETSGIDGLYAVGNALVGVRPEDGSVVRYDLDDAGRTVLSVTALLTGHPSLFGPTTGVLVDDELHFIANAQFDLVGPDGSLPPLSELADPVVLRILTKSGRAS